MSGYASSVIRYKVRDGGSRHRLLRSKCPRIRICWPSVWYVGRKLDAGRLFQVVPVAFRDMRASLPIISDNRKSLPLLDARRSRPLKTAICRHLLHGACPLWNRAQFFAAPLSASLRPAPPLVRGQSARSVHVVLGFPWLSTKRSPSFGSLGSQIVSLVPSAQVIFPSRCKRSLPS